MFRNGRLSQIARAHEGQGQQSSRHQKPNDQTVMDPVKAIALVEARVEKAEPQAGVHKAGPVEVAQEAIFISSRRPYVRQT